MLERPLTDSADEPTGTSPLRSKLMEIDPLDLVRDIWSAKWTLFGAIVAAILLSILSLKFADKSYTSSAVLGPAESTAQQRMGSSLGQLAGAASLLGVNIGGSNDTDFVKFKIMLGTERLAAAVLADKSVYGTLFGPSWDAKHNRWVRPSGISFEIKDALKGLLGLPQWAPVAPSELKTYLADHLGIFTDKMTGYVTLSISGTNPHDAAYLLTKIIRSADELIRQDVKNRSQGRIAYLQQALTRTMPQDQREAIITVLSAQEKTLMMTSADRSYSIDVIDPPTESHIPSSPQARPTMQFYILMLLVIVMIAAVVRGHFFVRRQDGYSDDEAYDPSFDAAARRFIARWWHTLVNRRHRETSISSEY